MLCAGAIAIAWRYLPRRGAYAPEEPPTRGSLGVIVRDHAFLLFLVSGALAYLVYVAIETVLPISARRHARGRAVDLGVDGRSSTR